MTDSVTTCAVETDWCQHSWTQINGESVCRHCGERLDLLEGGLRGTVSDAVNFAAELAQEWGTRVSVRVDERRENLPPIVAHRVDNDAPTWTVRATTDAAVG